MAWLGQDYSIYTDSLNRMIEALQQARIIALDQPDAPAPLLSGPGIEVIRGPGRPRKNIDPGMLQALTTSSRTTRNRLGELFECSGRTIRRRLVDYGLSPSGPPVYRTTQDSDGDTVQIFSPGTSSDLSSLSDNELDVLLRDIHIQFPSFGRRMIDGYLLQMGQRVPRSRVLASYERLFGPSDQHFAQRRIARTPYNVPGPNSLWHHDGQHGRH